MPKISKALEEIGKKITDLKNEINTTGKEANKLSTYMRLDPSNVKLVTDKWENLRKKLDAAKKLQEQYAKKEEELRKEIAKTKEGTEEYKALKDELTSTERAADKLKKTVEELNKRFELNQDKTEIAKAEAKKFADANEALQKKTEKTARTVAAVTAALVAFSTASIKAAEEVYSLSKSYGVSAENLQIYSKALEVATGQSDLYTKSLKAMSTGLAQVSAGRGVAYAQALTNIGLSAQQLSTLSREEAFKLIFEQLQNIANETERASAAQVLFGEAGLYVAQIAGQGAEAWEKYIAAAKEYGIITTEQAETAHKVNIEFSQMKSHLEAAGAELGGAFLPLIEQLTPTVKFFAQVLAQVAKGFNNIGVVGQIIIGLFVGTLLLLPKLVGWYIAWGQAQILAGKGGEKGALGVGAFTKAASKTLLVVSLISIAIIGLLALFGAFEETSKNTAASITADWENTADVLNNAGVDASAAIEQYSYESTEKTVNMYVEITGSGDTAISDDTASTVAMLTVDQFNKQLGELTK